MEMLIFFFISLFAGVFAAYYTEQFTTVSRNTGTYDPSRRETESIFNRLLKIKRQMHQQG